jgi:hypothetical protein
VSTTESLKIKYCEVSILNAFQSCTCASCMNGNGWIDIFRDIVKGGRPHRELLSRCLCPKTTFIDLSLEGEMPFLMHKWNCARNKCDNCGIENRLPFDCPVVQNSSQSIKMWVWDKATGGNERTMKKEIKIKDVFEELKYSLLAFSVHTFLVHLFNRLRYLNLITLGPNRAQICTDFSSQLDLIPPRKVSTSHTTNLLVQNNNDKHK